MSLKKKILLYAGLVAVIVGAVFAGLLYIPLGTGVHAFISYTPTGLSINAVSFKTLHALSLDDSSRVDLEGDRVIVMKVVHEGNEIFTVTRTGIGDHMGNFGILSPALPNLASGSELHVVIQLKNSSGDILAQDEASISV
jgi:hypothetical protein